MKFKEAVQYYLNNIKEMNEKDLKGKCNSCGEKIEDFEDEDYETSWIVMDNGKEYCGDCGPGKGKGKRYNLKGSMGIDLSRFEKI